MTHAGAWAALATHPSASDTWWEIQQGSIAHAYIPPAPCVAIWLFADGSLLEAKALEDRNVVPWAREVPNTPADLARLLASPHCAVRELAMRGLKRLS